MYEVNETSIHDSTLSKRQLRPFTNVDMTSDLPILNRVQIVQLGALRYEFPQLVFQQLTE